MADKYSYKGILDEMLQGIPNTLDKREGSIIHDTLAPTAFELAKQNYLISCLFALLMPDSAEGDWLDRNADNFGLARKPATNATRKLTVTDTSDVPMDVPIGTRYRAEDITVRVTAKTGTGEYTAEVEQLGTVGNTYTGQLLPIDHISGLGAANLTDVLIPADDTETDDDLRGRVYDFLRKTPFGGNVADYELKVSAIEGVGAVKVFTAETMGAGVVRLIIANEQKQAATAELIQVVSDAVKGDRKGGGIAPIGHLVTVGTSNPLTVTVAATVQLKTGASFELVSPLIVSAAQSYINAVGFADSILYHAKLLSCMLNSSDAVVDIQNMTINGVAGNLTLSKTAYNYQTPVAGTITLTEAT